MDTEDFAALLPDDQADYYLSEYDGSSWCAYYHAYRGIELALHSRTEYEEVIGIIEERTAPDDFLGNAELAHAVVSRHLSAHRSIWSEALGWPHCFATSIGHADIEFERLGLERLPARVESLLEVQVETTDPEQHRGARGVQSVLSEMIALARSPSGSLPEFERAVRAEERDFDEALASARRGRAWTPAPSLAAVEATAVTQPPRPGDSRDGERDHEGGFFLRLSGGAGPANTRIDAGSSRVEISGEAADINIAIGGIVAPNVALHGTIFGWLLTNPEVTSPDRREEPDVDEIDFTATGIGVTYYLMPANVYVSASVGVGMLMGEGKDAVEETDFGLATDLTIGKEWWVGEKWALGAAGSFGYHLIPDAESDETWSGTSLTLRFSATLN